MPQSLISTLSEREYYIGDQINQGAEGIIYKGYFFMNDKQVYVAIKLSENMKDDEIQFLDQLSTDPKPNLIKCYDVIISKQQKPTKVYTIMEIADIDLLKYLLLFKQKLHEEEKLKIAIDIVKGLKQLHELNFFHRDLKPENILKVGDVWKLCDFGLAKHQISITQTKFIGTPYYLSPEMINYNTTQDRDYGQEVDMWAFGCILYEIYTEIIFFEGDSYEKITESIKQFCNQNQNSDYNIKDQRFENLNMNEKIKNICKKLLVVNSQKRLTSNITLQILEDLDNLSIQQIDQIYQKEFNNNTQINSQSNTIQHSYSQNNTSGFQQPQNFKNLRTTPIMFSNQQQQNQNFQQQLNKQVPQTFNNQQIPKFAQNINQIQISQEPKDQQNLKNNNSLTLQPQANQIISNNNQKTIQPQMNLINNNQIKNQQQINQNISNNQIFPGFQNKQVDFQQKTNQFQTKQGPQTFVVEKKSDVVANQVDTTVKQVSFQQTPQKQDLKTSTESKPVFQQNQNNLDANIQNKQTFQNQFQGQQGFGLQVMPQAGANVGANDKFDPFNNQQSTQQNQFVNRKPTNY